MNTTFTPPENLNRIQLIALAVGIISAILCAIVGFTNKTQFFHSYLIGFIFWIGVSLGCLGLLMVQHTAGGAWGLVIRRLLESGVSTLPLMLVLFLPVLFGMHDIYPWTHADHVKANAILQKKAAYLNENFFIIRAAIYFVIWFALSFFLIKWSYQQDDGNGLSMANKMQSLSGIGLVIFVLTITFASVDWVMSLEPEWYSTIFGLLFTVGWGLSALAFTIMMLASLAAKPPLAGVIQPRHFHDVGKLMLAFVMLWAYFYFSQYLIIWSANLPEEITWYLRRIAPGWKWVGVAILVLHFALPFLLLLSRDLKKNARTLSVVALLVFIMRFVDVYWLIAPATAGHGHGHGTNYPSIHFHILDIAIPVAIGGLWITLFIWNLKRRSLIPVNDPLTEKALSHHAGGH
jgi:hypothetical protein